MGERSAAEWTAINERRLDLIDRKFSTGLSDQESAEFAAATRLVHTRMEQICPRSGEKLDGRLARLDRLRERLEAVRRERGEG